MDAYGFLLLMLACLLSFLLRFLFLAGVLQFKLMLAHLVNSCRLTRAGLSVGTDLTCAEQRNFSKYRTYKLINENGKERDVANDFGVALKACGVTYNESHSKGNSCLREKGDTQIVNYLSVTLNSLCGDEGADIFTCATDEYVDHANCDYGEACEYREIKLCAADNEEKHEYGSSPTVNSVHKLLGEVTDVAEDSSKHHTGEQGGELNVDRLSCHGNMEFHHRQGNGEKHEYHGH